MIKLFPTIHLLTGIATFLIFLGTGFYMQLHFPAAYLHNESIRYLFRANHIYILFAGLLNIVVGTYVTFSERDKQKQMQSAGSWALLLSQVVLMIAFFFEPPQAEPERIITSFGIYFALGGVALHALGRFRKH